MPDEVTLGEVCRRLEAFEKAFHELIAELKRDYARSSEVAELRRQVDSISATLTWLWRTVAGVIIVALLSLIVTRQGVNLP